MEPRKIIAGKFKNIDYNSDNSEFDREKSIGALADAVLIRNNDDMRQIMTVSFEKSTVAPIHGEPPIFGSTYLNPLLSANVYHKIDKDRDTRVVSTVVRELADNDPRRTLFYIKHGLLEIDGTYDFELYSEGTAEYKMKDTSNHVSKVKSITDQNELSSGLNTLVMYTSQLGLYEDAQIVSEPYAKRFSALSFMDFSLDVRPNTIFTGKGFPQFGEILTDKLAFSTNTDKNFSELINPETHWHRDRPFVVDDKGYFLADIDLVYDANYLTNEEFIDEDIIKLLENDFKYQKAIYDTIQNSSYPLGISCQTFLDDYTRRFIDNAELRDNDEKVNGIRMRFVYLKENEIKPGQKLAGLHGNKGTVSSVVIRQKMMTTEHGDVIDMLLAQHGIIGRANPGQLFELNINFLSWRMVKEMKEMNMPLEECMERILGFTKIVDTASYLVYKKKFKKFKTSLVKDILGLGIIPFRVKPTSKQLNIVSMGEVFDFVMSINPSKFKTLNDLLVDIYKDGVWVGRGMPGIQYIRRAKQKALSKLSIRGKGVKGSDGNNKKSNSKGIKDTPIKASEKDKLNEASVESAREMRIHEDNESKIEPLEALMQGLGGRVI